MPTMRTSPASQVALAAHRFRATLLERLAVSTIRSPPASSSGLRRLLDSTFSVADRATSGAVDGAHGGVYGVARSGGLYVAGAADYAHYNDTTTRTIAYNLNTGGAFNKYGKGSFGGDE